MKKYLIIILFLFAFLPKTSYALGSFGGYNLWTVPCACSGATIWYTWYAPLFINSPIPITGPLTIGLPSPDPIANSTPYVVPEPPLTVYKMIYDPLVPTTQALGKFVPGLQMCWQPAETGCKPWPVYGHIYLVGSSIPGALPIHP